MALRAGLWSGLMLIIWRRKALKLGRNKPDTSVSPNLPIDMSTVWLMLANYPPKSFKRTKLFILLTLKCTLRRSTRQASFALQWPVQVLAVGFQAYFIPVLATFAAMSWEEIYNTFWFRPTPNHYMNNLSHSILVILWAVLAKINGVSKLKEVISFSFLRNHSCWSFTNLIKIKGWFEFGRKTHFI